MHNSSMHIRHDTSKYNLGYRTQ